MSARRFSLASEEILLLNLNTGTLPVFRSRADAEIALKIYRRNPILRHSNIEDGNPWHLTFVSLFHMANDSDLFRDGDELADCAASFNGWSWRSGRRVWLPLYEAKLLYHYDHRYSTYRGATQAQLNKGTLPPVTDGDHDDPYNESLARYWVAASDVEEAISDPKYPIRPRRWDRAWFLGWRDVARASDVRTFIPCVIPYSAVGDKFLLVFFDEPRNGALLHAVWSSFVFDYVARQKLSGTGMKYFIVKQLACPRPEVFDQSRPWTAGGTLAEFVVPRVLELAYTSHRIAGYARDMGDDGPPFRWNPERREAIRAELDAAMFHVYGLTRPETEHVLDSFFVVEKYEKRDHGEFRTKRLVLDRYDAMAEAIRTGVPYQTLLDPPPGQGPRHPAQESHHG